MSVFDLHGRRLNNQLSFWCVHEQLRQILLIPPLRLIWHDINVMWGSASFAEVTSRNVHQRDPFYFECISHSYFITFTWAEILYYYLYFATSACFKLAVLFITSKKHLFFLKQFSNLDFWQLRLGTLVKLFFKMHTYIAQSLQKSCTCILKSWW